MRLSVSAVSKRRNNANRGGAETPRLYAEKTFELGHHRIVYSLKTNLSVPTTLTRTPLSDASSAASCVAPGLFSRFISRRKGANDTMPLVARDKAAGESFEEF